MASRWKAREEIWRKRTVNILALLVLGGVLYYLADRVEDRLTEAEETAVRVVLNNLRSQLVIEQSTAMAAREPQRLGRLQSSNPMELVAEVPHGYIEVCPEGAPSPGSWCFEEQDGAGVLWYYPRFAIEVEGFDAGAERLGWRLRVDTEDDRGEPLRLEAVQ